MKHIEYYQFSAKELSALVNLIGTVHGRLTHELSEIIDRIPPAVLFASMGETGQSINDIVEQVKERLAELQAIMPIVGPYLLANNKSPENIWVKRLYAVEKMLKMRGINIADIINNAE